MSIKKFNENGYVLIKNALNKDIVDIITQYALFDEIQDFSPDTLQVVGAHAKYADPAMESLLLYFLPLVEENTGLELYPTYSFYRVYRNGDILEPHTDRNSCEISITVCFNYNYDDEKYSWPIVMDGQKITMKPGDIVIYRGTELEHSRGEFKPPLDSWHVQGFFHYVDVNGKNAEYKYDKRLSLGLLPNQQLKKPYIQYTGR